MKNTIFFLISLLLLYLLLFCGILGCKKQLAQKNTPIESSISVFSTPELTNLTTKWVNEFCNENSDAKIKVISIKESSIAENLDKGNNLVFTTGELETVNHIAPLWKETVGRDVIVPVLNSKNPLIKEIKQQGITLEKFAQFINQPETRNWGTLIETQQNIPVNLYFLEDASVNSGMEKFLKVNQINIDRIKVEGGDDLIASVQNDLYSIGIIKLTSITDFNNQSFLENINLLPIDRNENGKMDAWENIYDDVNTLLRGVWIGKYPGVLSNNIYSVSQMKPTNKTELAFLKWVLTDGQKFLNNYGYNDLIYNERLAKVNLLDDFKFEPIATNSYALSKKALFYYVFFPIIVILFFVILIMVIGGIQYIKSIWASGQDIHSVPSFVFNENYVKSPQGLYYDKTHTWAFMQEDGMVKMGVDDFLQHTTGPLTSVKMKYPGEKVKKGKKILSIIQAGKQLDLYSPFSGIIKEHNKKLSTNTSIINSSPYAEGWIYKIEPTNWLKEIQFLFMGEKYKEWLKSEFSRLKEFFEVTGNHKKVEFANVLQDGGELKDGILLDFGPEVWEDFQTNFIDVSY